VGGDLTNRYYFAHAKSSSGKRVWGDDLNLCTSPQRFTIVLPQCPNENVRKFFKIDTGGARSVNHWLTCPSCIDSRLVSAVQRYVPYLEQVANSSAPLSYTTPDPVDIGPVDIEYSVARGPFQISVEGNRISISTRNLTKADIDGTGYIEEFARPQLDRLASTIDSKIHEIDVSRFININDLD
jgi:hypothetical protein